MILDAVGIDGLSESLIDTNMNAKKAARLAVNDGSRYGHSVLKRDMMRRVNLSSSYIGSSKSGRMRIGKYASSTERNPSAELVAQRRGTMLSRFLQNEMAMRRHRPGTPAKVMVRPGSVKAIDRAFAMRLSGGQYGLVQRVSGNPAHHPGSKGAKRIKPGLFLLYGPSVSQIMETTIQRNNYIQRDIGFKVSDEFQRQFARLNSGG